MVWDQAEAAFAATPIGGAAVGTGSGALVGPVAGEAIRCMLEVVVEDVGGELRVAGPKGLEHRDVLVGDPAPVGAGHAERDVGAGEWLQRAPHPGEGGVAGQVDDPLVEPGVGERLGMGVAGVGAALHLPDELLEPGEVVVDEPRDGEPGRQRLQLGPHHEGLQELGRRRAADTSSTEGADLHDPEGLEISQRLADGRLAGAQVARDTGLDDPGPRGVPAIEDRLEQVILDLVAQHAARDRALAVHGVGSGTEGRLPRGSPRSRRCRRRGSGRRS